MLKQDMLGPEQFPRAVAVMERNATSLARIVGDVFDVSRIASGKVRLRAQSVDISLLVAQSLEAVEATADAKGVRLDMSAPADPLLLEADPDRLQQVMWNLLSNSVKFTPDGGQVHVEVRRTPDGRHVEIVVTDTGIGIATEFVPHIFEPFRQADSRLAREHGGLGLGLAISRHLVELHGGTITGESAGLERGATFTLSLPLAGNSTETIPGGTAPSDPAAIGSGGQTPRLDGLHVLVLDDDADALAMTGKILEAAGARVTEVNSAERALTMATETRPDVILSDIGMPRMDGFEFITRLRALADPVSRVPAAALTAFTRQVDHDRALASGFHLHLSKPIDPAELVRAVRVLVALAPKPGTMPPVAQA
jgi:CheY-like chemotaxis protein/two-component sensor histidine kinase